MPAPATHDFVHLEISSASVLNTGVNGPINYLIGRNIGFDDAIELEGSLEILSGSGNRYLRLPQGTTGQRPTGAAGMLRHNTTDSAPDFHDGTNWQQILLSSVVNFETLNINGDVGEAVGQLAEGNHGHSLNIIRFDASSSRTARFMTENALAALPVQQIGFNSGTYLLIGTLYLGTDESGTFDIRDETNDTVLVSKAYSFDGSVAIPPEVVMVEHTFDGTESLQIYAQRPTFGQVEQRSALMIADFSLVQL